MTDILLTDMATEHLEQTLLFLAEQISELEKQREACEDELNKRR